MSPLPCPAHLQLLRGQDPVLGGGHLLLPLLLDLLHLRAQAGQLEHPAGREVLSVIITLSSWIPDTKLSGGEVHPLAAAGLVLQADRHGLHVLGQEGVVGELWGWNGQVGGGSVLV